jgi:hypothetical protein
VVVGQDGPLLTRAGTDIAARDAEVSRGRQRGVEDVERVGAAVAVAVGGVTLPGGGDELHRPDGAVPHRVAVQSAVIGVADDGRSVAVQRDADDGPGGGSVGAQLSAAEATVVRLDPPDPGQQRPGEVAARIADRESPRRPAVGLQRGQRDAAARQRGHDGRHRLPTMRG